MTKVNPVLMVAPELALWKTGGVANLVKKLANALTATGRARPTVLGTARKVCRPAPPHYHSSIEFELIEKPEVSEPFCHSLLQLRYRAALREWVHPNPRGIVHFGILPGARALLAAEISFRRQSWPPEVFNTSGWVEMRAPK
jgi:hypothetical protein